MEQKDYSPWIEDDSKQFIMKGVDPVPRIIVSSANRFPDGLIIAGSRHWSPVMRKIADRLGLKGVDEDQGFIDQYDQFVCRKDAKRIAIANNQKLIRDDWGDELFSENLY